MTCGNLPVDSCFEPGWLFLRASLSARSVGPANRDQPAAPRDESRSFHHGSLAPANNSRVIHKLLCRRRSRPAVIGLGPLCVSHHSRRRGCLIAGQSRTVVRTLSARAPYRSRSQAHLLGFSRKQLVAGFVKRLHRLVAAYNNCEKLSLAWPSQNGPGFSYT
jgi:hypothetical protein